MEIPRTPPGLWIFLPAHVLQKAPVARIFVIFGAELGNGLRPAGLMSLDVRGSLEHPGMILLLACLADGVALKRVQRGLDRTSTGRSH